jgi:DNA-binding protein YbaB
MSDISGIEDVQRVLSARSQSNVTVTTDTVSVTVSPRYQIVDVTINASSIDQGQREALQRDLMKAVNEAMQSAALAAARALGELSLGAGVEELRSRLKKGVDANGRG